MRFSWATIKVVLEKDAHPVEWSVRLIPQSPKSSDHVYARRTDDGQASLVKAFESATGREKDRCMVAKDLNLKSVGML